MDIKLAHMLINNLTSIPDDHDDLWFYLKTLKGDVPKEYKPTKVECLEHLELKVNEQIRQWESIRTRIKNYHNGLNA
jgi:hypothetical protein